MTDSPAARICRNLDHPVIDADGHWLETVPVFLEYLAETAGPKAVDQYLNIGGGGKVHGQDWYRLSPAERTRNRIVRPGWWGFSSNAMDRTASMIPSLFHHRLDEWGIDYALVYPSLGLLLPSVRDDQLRRSLARAYNVMVADLFRPFSDRLTPAGICPMNTPEEAIDAAKYSVETLGLKLLVMNCAIPRTIAADAEWQPDPGKRRIYIDSLGRDSPYDYDPVWAKMIELGVAVTAHTISIGWPDRSSPTSFISNHLGHFAQSHHTFARGIVMGGVPQRFPELNFGFLEGGVGWACSLYADLLSHWDKRNKATMHRNVNPGSLDRAKLRELLMKHAGNEHFLKNIDDIVERNLFNFAYNTTAEDLARRDFDSDDFAETNIASREDIHRVYKRSFYFGCEADDPINMWAFDPRGKTQLKAMLGSDITHFDVIDPSTVLPEAWEAVEERRMTEESFKDFVFGNVVELHGAMNPRFFDGTVVEAAARRELARRERHHAPEKTSAAHQ